MRFFNYLSVTFISLALTACSTMSQESTKHDNDYLKQGYNVPPTKLPQNLSATTIQTFYPIPPVTMGPLQQPSIIPPGSQMDQRQTQQSMASPAPIRASTVIASSNNSLMVNTPFMQAWGQTGNALRAAGYKVMQQDKSMGAYFILDLAGTGGQLKTNTPIYQIHLKPVGNNTSITLFDDKGTLANAAVGSRILGDIKHNL